MDIKEKIEELVEKIKSDKDLAANFQNDPIATLEKLLGVDLPDEQIQALVDGIKAKLDLDSASGILGTIKNLFGK